MNTLDVETGEDEIASPQDLFDFLARAGFAGATGDLDARDVERAGEVREALRELLAGNAGHGTDPAALAVLDREAGRAHLAVRFDEGGPRLAAAGHGLDAALGVLFGAIAAASVDGTFVRLKVCRDSTCRYAFFDTSRNRSGTWCSMAVCGNRNKGRAYRRRRGAERGQSAPVRAPRRNLATPLPPPPAAGRPDRRLARPGRRAADDLLTCRLWWH